MADHTEEDYIYHNHLPSDPAAGRVCSVCVRESILCECECVCVCVCLVWADGDGDRGLLCVHCELLPTGGTPQKSHHPRPKGAGPLHVFCACPEHSSRTNKTELPERCSDSRVLSFLEMTFCDQAYSDLAFEWLNDSTTANYVREYDYSWRPVKLSTKDDIWPTVFASLLVGDN